MHYTQLFWIVQNHYLFPPNYIQNKLKSNRDSVLWWQYTASAIPYYVVLITHICTYISLPVRMTTARTSAWPNTLVCMISVPLYNVWRLQSSGEYFVLASCGSGVLVTGKLSPKVYYALWDCITMDTIYGKLQKANDATLWPVTSLHYTYVFIIKNDYSV